MFKPDAVLIGPERGFGIDIVDAAVNQQQITGNQRNGRQFDGRPGKQPAGQPVAQLQFAQFHKGGVVDELLSDLGADAAEIILRIRLNGVRTTVLVDAFANDETLFPIPPCSVV